MSTMKSHLTTIGEVKDDNILRVVLYFMSSNGNVATAFAESKGIMAVYPGSCAMIQDIKSQPSKHPFFTTI